jgi:C-terminal processing protease CtpA/Prc
VEAGGRRVGVLRIEAFMPGAADCAEAARQLGVSDDGECDDLCRARIANRAETSFVARLDERVRTLAASRPDLLLVDLARNGGGSDSAISAARMIGGGDLQAPRVARMAGEPLLADIKDDRALLRAALPGASAEDAALLRRLDSDLAQAEAQAQRTCDRSPLWRGERIGCTALVSGPFHAGGLLPGGLPGRQDGPDWVDPVDATVRHKYTPGSWKGPVLVLVDGDTASAAELFTAMLQDAGRARVIGAPSFGSGCGWMLPRRPVTLPHSGGRLLMPDCARFRRDGRNELDGVQPDFLVGLRTYDSARQRAERLRPKLDEAVAALLGPKRRR